MCVGCAVNVGVDSGAVDGWSRSGVGGVAVAVGLADGAASGNVCRCVSTDSGGSCAWHAAHSSSASISGMVYFRFIAVVHRSFAIVRSRCECR